MVASGDHGHGGIHTGAAGGIGEPGDGTVQVKRIGRADPQVQLAGQRARSAGANRPSAAVMS